MAVTEQFVVVDSQGRRHAAVKIQQPISTRTLGSGGSSLMGLAEYKLATGERLNHRGNGLFEQVSTGEQMQRE